MKLLFVDSSVPYMCKVDTVFSLCGNASQEASLQNLIPRVQLPTDDSIYFWYANYVMTYDEPFLDLMKIIYALYEGKDVAVIINTYVMDYADMIRDLIFRRYNLISYIIQDIIDLESVVECDFSIAGLEALDVDKQRMVSLMNHYQPMNHAPEQQLQTLYDKNVKQ